MISGSEIDRVAEICFSYRRMTESRVRKDCIAETCFGDFS